MPINKHRSTSKNEKPLFQRLLSPYYLIPVLLIIVFIVYIYYQGSSSDQLHRYHQVTMSFSVEMRFSGVDKKTAKELKEDVFAEMDRLEAIFSRSLQDSEINHINRQAVYKPVSVSDELLYVALQAQQYALLSEGAFDPTIAPLIDLWGFLGEDYRLPTVAEIEETLPLVDYTLLDINSSQSTIYLAGEGMALELGGIAKGYIIDRLLDVLAKAGVRHAFINAGGDIGLIGNKPDGNPWLIGIGHPREDNKIIAVLPASGGAVVTSGGYERMFTEDEIIYHHILDPKSGMPARQLASVTIVAPTVIEADALSTAVFVYGPLKGMALIEKIPGVEGVLITRDLEILISSGLKGIIELNP